MKIYPQIYVRFMERFKRSASLRMLPNISARFKERCFREDLNPVINLTKI